MGPSISIILPVYNVEPWLKNCLISVQNQSMENWEAIFVIDGSPDQSEAIVREAAALDPRIKILTQENQGTGAARNSGVAHAQGEYLFFLDPDDLIPPNALEEAHKAAVEHNADIVLGDYKKFKDQKNYTPLPAPASTKFNQEFSTLPSVFCRQDLSDDFFYHSFHFITICWKLFKKSVWNQYNIQAPADLRMSEDILPAKKMFLVSNKICKINHTLLYYRRHAGSITSKRSLQSFDVFPSYEFSKEAYNSIKASKRDMTLLHLFYIRFFFLHLVKHAPLNKWFEFYKKICSAAKKIKPEEIKLEETHTPGYMDRIMMSILHKDSTFLFIPYMLIAFLYYILPILIRKIIHR